MLGNQKPTVQIKEYKRKQNWSNSYLVEDMARNAKKFIISESFNHNPQEMIQLIKYTIHHIGMLPQCVNS